jgi:hypothetical protein
MGRACTVASCRRRRPYSSAAARTRIRYSQLTPTADEGLLDGVLGELRVAEHQLGDRVEAVDLARGEQRKGVSIPALRPLDELLSHLYHLGRAGQSTGS